MSLSIRSKIERNYRDESQTAIENKGMGMPKRYYSYFPWLRTAPRSARLIISTLVSGIALGLGAAVVSLFVLSHAQKRPVTPIPIEATATASVPAAEKVGPANEARPSPSMGEATAMSASDDSQSKWSLQLIGDSSETRALAEYRNLQKRFPAILGSRTPVVIKRELGGRGSAFWYQVRLTEDSQERATALCMQLRSAGGECLVMQPSSVEAKLTFDSPMETTGVAPSASPPPPSMSREEWKRSLIEAGRQFCQTYPDDEVCGSREVDGANEWKRSLIEGGRQFCATYPDDPVCGSGR